MGMQLKNSRWLILSAIVLVLDQLSKYWVMQNLVFNQPYKILPVFNLYYAINKGAAFSMLSDKPQMALWFFSSVAVIVSIGVLIWLMRLPTDKKLLAFSLSCIVGGAIGNLIDRIRFNHVIDFIQLHVQQYYWPVFNLADTAIVIGATLLVLDTLMHRERQVENSTR